MPQPMRPRPFRIQDRFAETPDTITFVLENLEDPVTPFRPGQFMMIYVFGVGEVPISIAGNPKMPHNLVHTVRAVGAVTDAICALGPGDVVGARGPYGRGWPVDEATDRHLVIVAGGVGLAPLRPAVLEGLTRRGEYQSLTLLYGARTPTDLLYKQDLLGWKASPDIDLEVTVDQAPTDWWGDVGMVTSLIGRASFQPSTTDALVCGPEVMMRAVARELRDRGVAVDRISISLERNMKCALGFCGRCQFGSDFLCKSGPVVSYGQFAGRLSVNEL